MKITYRRVATVIAFGVVTALSFAGAAQAITDTVFRYSSPKTGFYTIRSAAMVPRDTTAAQNYSNSGSDGGLTVLGQERCFLAGVNLPHGVTITGVRVWYSSGLTGNPKVRLHAHVLDNGLPIMIYGRTIMDNSGLRKVVNLFLNEPAHQKIDNAHMGYALDVCIFPDDIFFAARFTYTYETAGD